MEKLQHAFAVLLEKIGNVGTALRAEQRVVKHQHGIWEQANAKQDDFTKTADEQRKLAHKEKKGSAQRRKHKAAAQKFDLKAEKQGVKAAAAKRRAQPHIGNIKRLARRKHGLEHDAEEVKSELAALKSDHGVKISGNRATGGTKRQRIVAVALASVAACSAGRRRNGYTQSGHWDADHPITGEGAGARSDCSQWEQAVCKCANINPDPTKQNYGGGFTGTTLLAPVASKLKPGVAIVYGSGNGFHTELYIGPGNRTAGHGSPPIDFGIVDLIPGVQKRYRDLCA